MDRRIAELNIEHFQKKLAEESDPQLRETMQRLLKEEQAKLREILRQLNESKTCG
jgi:rubrerythrin